MSQVLVSSFVTRAPVAASLPSSLPSSLSSKAPSGAVTPWRHPGVPFARLTEEGQFKGQVKGSSTSGKEALALSVVLSLSAAESAQALEPSDVIDTFQKVEAFAETTGQFLGKVFEVTKSVVETVVRVAKPAVEAAAPVVRDAAQSALEAASPVVADTASKAVRFLEDQGVDLQPVVQASKAASDVTTTLVRGSSVVTEQVGRAVEVASPAILFLQAQSPPVLAAGAGALVLLYLSTPAILSSIATSIRGYSGDLTPAQALDKILSADFILIDVRSESEKESSGIPSLPRNARKRLLSVPIEGISENLRDQLKNPRALEAELTAIRIASYKKLSRGSKVIVIDSKGDVARIIAKSLSSLGFRATFAVQDGMDGSRGWVNGELPVDFYESKAELLAPGLLSFGRTGSFGRTRSFGATQVISREGTAEAKAPESRPGLLLPSGKTTTKD